MAQNPNQPGQLAEPFKPLTNGQKFKYRVVETLGIRGFIGAAIGATSSQVINYPVEWHRTAAGFGKRYASVFGTGLTRETLDYALESAFKEDPRYFPLDHGSFKDRLWSAISQSVTTRTDSDKTTFAWARVSSALITGQITRAWLPHSANSVGDGFRTGGISLSVDAGVNALYEFFPSLRPRIH